MRVYAERSGMTPMSQVIPEQFAKPLDFRLWLPDLTNPATLGCVLALVREEYEKPGLSTIQVDGEWYVGLIRWDLSFDFVVSAGAPSEAEALVVALERWKT